MTDEADSTTRKLTDPGNAHVVTFADDSPIHDPPNGSGVQSEGEGRRSLTSLTVSSIASGRKDSVNSFDISKSEITAGHARTNSYWSMSEMSFTPHIVEESRAVVAWQDLTVSSKKFPDKKLLNRVCGRVTGGFWAVMGPSGSGKSTLLNTLACRLTPGMYAEGELRLNGRIYSLRDLKTMSGYVMQDDLMNGTLTVEETIYYAGELRLPREMTAEHRRERVEESINEMGIDHVRHVVIGDALRKGISGGERKRLAVAMELLTHPLLLFLDEPTSGLDSVTALSLCMKLKALAASGRTTVVCTIHQPQSKLYALFDNLILLKSGDIVYQGPAMKAIIFFEKAGFPCPPMTNPADHLLDVITPGLGEDHAISKAKEEKLRKYFKQPVVDLNYGQEKPLRQMRDVIPWSKQYAVLLRRSMKEILRKWDIIVTQLANAIIMAILIGFAFYKIGTYQVSINKRQAVLFFTVINQGIFASLQTINSFPSERALVLRERAAGTYYVSAYFLAKTTADTATQIVPPLIFSAIVYHLVGLQDTQEKFWVYAGFMILCQLSATSIASMVSTLARTTDLSVVVLPAFFELGRLFGGFFLPPVQLPHYFVWLDALSYVKYTYTGISLNELRGLKMDCLASELKNGVCPYTTGEQTIERLGLDYITRDQAAGILIVFIVMSRFIAYLGLRYIKW